MFSFGTPAASSGFGAPSQQPQAGQQGQQQGQQQPPATPGPLTLDHLSRPAGGSSFGFGQPQQPQQQPQQGLFGGQQTQQTQWGSAQPPQQQQQGQGGAFGSQSWGMGSYGAQPQQQQQPGQASQFGQAPPQQAQGMQPPQQQPGQPQQFQPFGGYGAPQQQANQQMQAQQQGVQAPEMQYLPGYLAKLRGGRPYSSPTRAEPQSPPHLESTPARGSGAGARGHEGSSGTEGATSPSARFSSSFFSSPAAGGASSPERSTAAGGPGGATREGSIFGPSGLRGSRRAGAAALGQGTPSRESVGPVRRRVSSSLRNSSGLGFSPPRGGGAGFGAQQQEEDDAPPTDVLADESAAYAQASATLRSSTSANLFPAGASAAAAAPAPAPSSATPVSIPAGGAPVREDAAARTIVVYGFGGAYVHAVAEHFQTLGAVVGVAHEAEAALRIEYTESFMALRALRRTGEALPLAGGAYVGVRWASDEAHRHAVLYGLDASSSLGASPLPGHASTNALTVASSNQLGASRSGSSTPAFGRPISVVGEPASAFAKRGVGASGAGAGAPPGGASGSPFFRGASALLGGAGSNPSTPSKPGAATPATNNGQQLQKPADGGTPSGVMGRIGDAIFGW